MLIHSFVSSCVDHCNYLIVGAPKKWTDKHQGVINAAARVLSNEEVRQGLYRILHDELHWLDVSERRRFDLYVHVYKCIHDTKMHVGSMPASFCSGKRTTCCITSGTVGVWEKGFLIRWYISLVQTSLPNYLKESSLSLDMFKRSLKTFFILKYSHIKCIRDVCMLARYKNLRYFKFAFTITFTLLLIKIDIVTDISLFSLFGLWQIEGYEDLIVPGNNLSISRPINYCFN